MENISTGYNRLEGIILLHSKVSMALTSSHHNQNSGIYISTSVEINILNSSFVSNNGNGMKLLNTFNTRIICLSLRYNGEHGLVDTYSYNTTLTDSYMADNKRGDIRLINIRGFNIIRTVAYIRAHTSNDICLQETIFSGMHSSSTISSTIDPTSLPAVVELYNSNVKVHNCS